MSKVHQHRMHKGPPVSPGTRVSTMLGAQTQARAQPLTPEADDELNPADAAGSPMLEMPQLDEGDGAAGTGGAYSAGGREGSRSSSVSSNTCTPRAGGKGAPLQVGSHQHGSNTVLDAAVADDSSGAHDLDDLAAADGGGGPSNPSGDGDVGSDEEAEDERTAAEAYSLYIFAPTNPFRVLCNNIARSVWFQGFILVCILLNGALLAVDEPGRDKSDELESFLFIADVIFFSIFFIEMVIKIVAYGFVMHKGAYLRTRWNVFDAFIVVASGIGLILGSATNITTLRVFRVLRPLRSIQRVKQLRTLITALFDAIPEVGNNLLLFLFILILFGISGVVLFAGDLTFRCYATEFVGNAPPQPANVTWDNISTPFLILDDPDICGGTRKCPNLTAEYGVKSDCVSNRDLYYRRNLNFDHLLSSGLLTLKVMTLDDWNEDLADVMNARGQVSSLWFVVLTFVGAFICVNLFLAILTQAYHNRVVENAKEEVATQVDEEVLDSAYAQLRHEEERRIEASTNPLSGPPTDAPPGAAEADSMEKSVESKSDSRSRGASPLPRRPSKKRSVSGEQRTTKRTSPSTIGRKSPADRKSPDDAAAPPQKSTSDIAFNADGRKRKVKLKRVSKTQSAVLRDHKRSKVDEELAAMKAKEEEDAKLRRKVHHQLHYGEFLIDDEIEDLSSESEGEEGCCADMTCAKLWGVDETGVIVDEDDDDRAPWRKKLGSFMDSIGMQAVMTFVTLVQVATLAIDYHGIDPAILRAMDMVSLVCTIIYAINLTFVIIGEGFIRTFKSGFNVLDLVLILLAIPDIVLAGEDTGSGDFAVFRIFRLLRLLRFLRIKRLQPIVRTIMDSVSSIGFLSLLILLFLYIFSVTGMQVFGTDYGAKDPEERNRFGTIWQSAITTFIAITGDNWTTLMRVAMTDYANGLEIIPVAFFVTVYMIGNYILINLSVAIILDSLESKLAILDVQAEEEHPPLLILPRFNPPKRARLTQQGGAGAAAGGPHNSGTDASGSAELSMSLSMQEPGPSSPRRKSLALVMPSGNGTGTDQPSMPSSPTVGFAEGSPTSPTAGSSNGFDEATGPSATAVLFADAIRDRQSSFATRWRKIREYLLFIRPVIVEEDSFFVFGPENSFRRAMITIASSNLFERFIDFVIIVNMVFLCFEGPNNSNSLDSMLRSADYVFTSIFGVEMIIKMIAYGAVYPENDRVQAATGFAVQEAYFRDPWNWVDFIVVAMSIAAYFVPLFRASRALRALRLMTRFETTKIIIVAVLEAIPHVLQTLVFVVFVFFVLGVMGVKFFKGRFYRCSDETIIDRYDCHGTFTAYEQGPIFNAPTVQERQWTREPYHFDHLGSALLTLFVVTVGDGWSEIMFTGMDSDSQEDRALQVGNRDWMAIFFVTTFITCNFFALNMMIGVLVSYFAKKKRLHDGSALLTPAQRMYVKARFAIDATLTDDQVPRETKAAKMVDLFLTYRHPRVSENMSLFDIAMMVVIVINTIVIASTYDGMSSTHETGIDVTNHVALGIFAIEAILKLFAYGVLQYFSQTWNTFDFTIVVVGLIGVIVNLPGVSVFRVLRVFKMIKGSGVERLLISLFRGVSSFVNITGLLALTFFVYAVAGVILFGNVKLQGAITINYNFRTVPNAMLTLYTVATGAGWAEVMDACGVEPPKCEPELDNCGNLPGSVAFFVSFMVVCSFIVLQLFVAVVVEIFLDDVNFSDPVIMAFATMRQQWNERFGAGTQSVSVQELAEIVREFPPALSDITWEPTRADVLRFLGALNVPVDSSFDVQYKDIVNALAFRKFKVDLRSMAKYVNDAVVSVFGTRAFTASQAYAILVIQRMWRKREEYLNQRVAPLIGISTDAWLARVVARRKAKQELSGQGSDSMHLRSQIIAPPVPTFRPEVDRFVPAGGISVPGCVVYAFPLAETLPPNSLMVGSSFSINAGNSGNNGAPPPGQSANSLAPPTVDATVADYQATGAFAASMDAPSATRGPSAADDTPLRDESNTGASMNGASDTSPNGPTLSATTGKGNADNDQSEPVSYLGAMSFEEMPPASPDRQRKRTVSFNPHDTMPMDAAPGSAAGAGAAEL